MSQSQNTIYYTTAQVTDMVELSDQNVRKYVRLLEDRSYEVAKDEHNRRLFSKKDVNILQEMIRIAKSPGNTLDSAADEIVNNMDDFEEIPENNQPAKMTDNEVSNLLTLVLEKLDEIQNENKELKTNIKTLVNRLEDYDLKALEYNSVEQVEVSIAEEFEEDALEEVAAEEETIEKAPEVIEAAATGTDEQNSTEEVIAETDEPDSAEDVVAETEEQDSAEEEVPLEVEPVTEETTEKVTTENDGKIDLSAKEEPVEEEKVDNSETVQNKQEEPKKGFFGKLASMFKG